MTPETPPGAVTTTRPAPGERTYRIVGLDLSLTATGVSDGTETVVIRSTGDAGASLYQRRKRLTGLAAKVELAVGHRPDLVVIEGPAMSRSNGHMHDRSGLWWLVIDALHERDIVVAEVSPTALKKYATGKGNADKGAVIEAATRRLPEVETGGHDGRCDALWLAAMGYDYLGQPLCPMPALNRAALDSVRW